MHVVFRWTDIGLRVETADPVKLNEAAREFAAIAVMSAPCHGERQVRQVPLLPTA